MFRHDVNMAINTPKMRTSFIEGAVGSLSNSSHIVETSQYVAEYITVSFNVVNVCLRMFLALGFICSALNVVMKFCGYLLKRLFAAAP